MLRLARPLRRQVLTGYFQLPASASEAELRDAYYAVAKRLHPDVAGEERAADFKHAQEAYEAAKFEIRARDGQLSVGEKHPFGEGYYRGTTQTDYYRGGRNATWSESSSYNPYGSDAVTNDPWTKRKARYIAAGVMVAMWAVVLELFSASCGQRMSYKPFWKRGGGGWARRYDSSWEVDQSYAARPPPDPEEGPRQPKSKEIAVSSFYTERIPKLRSSVTQSQLVKKKQDGEPKTNREAARAVAEAQGLAAAARRNGGLPTGPPSPEELRVLELTKRVRGGVCADPLHEASVMHAGAVAEPLHEASVRPGGAVAEPLTEASVLHDGALAEPLTEASVG